MNETGAIMSKLSSAVLAVTLSLFSAGAAMAELRQNPGQDANSPFLREYGSALPPIGHVAFCKRLPAECAAREEAMLERRVELDSGRKRGLRKINALVNDMVVPVTDQDLYGRIEHWTYPDGKGDCEDYVLLKRRLLIERGWPESALLITVVRDENNEGHAVLTVRTAQGEFVLDNKRPEILAWNATGYKFVKRQSRTNPANWISLAAPTGHRPRGDAVSTSR